MTTRIEWAEETWNPITGCTPISVGCENCYAERMSKRLAGRYGYPKDEPFKVTFHPDRLDQPLQWRKPRKIFVCSMGDLFHEDVKFEWFKRVMDTICDPSYSWNHKFLMLTKRPERMVEFFKRLGWWFQPDGSCFPHIWLGVTAENQKRADERIPILLQIPSAVRFVSVEPMLGPVDLHKVPHPLKHPKCKFPVHLGVLKVIDWVICGGESGPGARPMHPGWVRSLRDQCVDAGTPFMFKQWGEFVYEFHSVADGRICKDDTFVEKVNGYYKGLYMCKVGKKQAGRTLDGEVWDQYPKRKSEG